MNKHFVILEDGTKATRNSQNRTYTHAVAISPLDRDVAIEQLTTRINTQEQYKAAAINLVSEIKEQGVTISERASLFGNMWLDFSVNGKTIYLDGIYKAGTITAEEATAKAIEVHEASIENCDRQIAARCGNIATIKERGQSGDWAVVAWCGRYDLAEKQLAKWSDRRGHTVKIVEVRVGA